MAPSRHDWKIVDWDVKPQHNQPTFKKDIKVWSSNIQSWVKTVSKYVKNHTVMILSFRTDMPGQTVQTQISSSLRSTLFAILSELFELITLW